MVQLHAQKARLAGLSIRDFRNYDECRIDISASNILLLGENGAGKTNLMEAISLLAPGRGLRRGDPEPLSLLRRRARRRPGPGAD